jgi:hypothetical protein
MAILKKASFLVALAIVERFAGVCAFSLKVEASVLRRPALMTIKNAEATGGLR